MPELGQDAVDDLQVQNIKFIPVALQRIEKNIPVKQGSKVFSFSRQYLLRRFERLIGLIRFNVLHDTFLL
jgi:hypothetical protein